MRLHGINVYLVIDEAHYIKQPGGQWADAVLKVAGHSKKRCILTGTPFPKSFTDAFNLFDVLWPEDTDLNLVPSTVHRSVLSVKLNGDVIKGNTVTELYRESLKFIVSKKLDIDDFVPYATSAKRYLIAKSPFHPEDKKFRVPVKFSDFYMEAHKNRIQALKDLARFFKKLGFNVQIIE